MWGGGGGSGGREVNCSLPALPFDEKSLSAQQCRFLGELTCRRAGGKQGRGCGPWARSRGRTSRSCSEIPKSEGNPQAGSVFHFPSSSSSGFPQEEKNWVVEPARPRSRAGSPESRGQDPTWLLNSLQQELEEGGPGLRPALLDLSLISERIEKTRSESQEESNPEPYCSRRMKNNPRYLVENCSAL